MLNLTDAERAELWTLIEEYVMQVGMRYADNGRSGVWWPPNEDEDTALAELRAALGFEDGEGEG